MNFEDKLTKALEDNGNFKTSKEQELRSSLTKVNIAVLLCGFVTLVTFFVSFILLLFTTWKFFVAGLLVTFLFFIILLFMVEVKKEVTSELEDFM